MNLVSVPYRPSSTLSGNELLGIYRGKNMKLRGREGDLYYEVYSGSLNLNEIIPTGAVTGALSFDITSDVITGVGTAFQDELHLGMLLQANTEPLAVVEIISQTSFRAGRIPTSNGISVSAVILPVLFPIDIQRGTLLHGNAIVFDKGTILCVGAGVLRVNGNVLPGDSLTATRRAQVALYDSSTNTYDVQPIGFDVYPTITNTDVTVVASGGTKNMSLGYYSFRVAYYSTVTTGYGNPSPTLLQGGLDGYHLTVANSTFNFNFSADIPPANASGYIIYGSAFNGTSDISKVNAIEGGWFQISDPIPFTDLTAGHWVFDYIDTDLFTLVSFDNDTPPDAEFYASLDRYPFLVSTNGRGVNTTGREKETSPGAFVSPIKAENFDAYPNTYKVPTEKGEVIIGAISAAGRIFVLTSNTLQAVTPTGIPSAPFTCRPFWKRGFQGQYNVCFVDDTLYGFTTAGAFRSIAQGDEGNESNNFAANVEAQMANWHGAFVFVVHDPKNEEICFIYSASRKNDDGYWESDIFPYSLRQNDWVTPVILSSSTRDMIVSGAATVGGHMEFIAGGRLAPHSTQFDTFRYDANSGEAVPWYLAFTYTDNDVELNPKVIKQIRPKGKFTDCSIQVYATTPDTDVDVLDLEIGANAAFEYSLDDSTSVKQYAVEKMKVKNALMWTARIEGTYSGTGTLDQFHELALSVSVSGGVK